jgi:GTP-binding protein
MSAPLVALVGRPNVGKSTLFNRIVGARLAIVEEVAGTTRDRLYAASDWGGRDFRVVDTGGLALDEGGEITTRIRNQALVAMEEADVIVLLTDGQDGVTSGDRDVAQLLRRSGKPIVLAVNKTERPAARQNAAEFWELGLGEPQPVSALHGTGTGDLLDHIVELLPESGEVEEAEQLRVAIVGRPNVGKSSLLNCLVGRERMIVSEAAGTTREAVDTQLVFEGEPITLVDTAGIRRRGRVEPGIERYSVLRAVRAIERCDVAVLVVDAQDGVTAQDTHIGGLIRDAGKGAIIAINKWDLIEKDHLTADAYAGAARAQLQFLDFAPVVLLSALTGQRAPKVLSLAREIWASRSQRVSTGELNRLVAEIQARHELSRKGRPLKLKYATQVGVEPPTFVFFVNDRALVHFSYERFIENRLREAYPFEGTPIRLIFRQRERPARARAGAPAG